MKRNKTIKITKVSAFLLLLYVLSSCTDESIGKDSMGGGGHTLTLTLSATTAPLPETKAVVRAARSGSEAAAAGFSYELVSSDTDTTATAPGTPAGSEPLATKAPTTLKNVYALLFTSDGAFNGRASLGIVTAGTATDITFTNVATPAATGCRLVIVANDNAATNSYASTGGTGGFASFSGTYASFQALTMTNTITADADIPYAGSVTGLNLAADGIDGVVSISLYRTLAKVVLNNTFSITSGPTRSSITLCNAGTRRFATAGTDSYDGTGSTQTTAYTPSTLGTNANSVIFYAGENIRPAGGSAITTPADRNSSNAPTNASYIRIASTTLSVAANTNPQIGEEYTLSGTKSFTYDIYLGKSSVVTDFSLRRHTNYTITSAISGSLAVQEALAAMDGRVTLTATGGESAGLAIGRFGGPSGYTTGTGAAPTISGSYTRLLLLQPNTSGSTATDNVSKVWGASGTEYQLDTRRYWDKSYIYSIITGGTVGGMNPASGSLYDYCYQLTLGNVAKGAWYVPTQAQLQAIWTVYAGLKGGGYAGYAAFDAIYYWSCTEYGTGSAWSVGFGNGGTYNYNKTYNNRVRCVRDL